MANPTIELISALRETATRLRNGVHYSWGHHGACNCGNLVQVVTQLSKEEIIRYAHTGIGDWTELTEGFCPVTNAPLSLVIQNLEKIGLTTSDIHHIEYLDDKAVLNNLPGGFRWLKRNNRNDVIAYFNAFANLLEDELLRAMKINITDLLPSTQLNITELKYVDIE
ncbi:MAG: hypothetical protein ABJB11_06145 [Ferruginibacter sp.]